MQTRWIQNKGMHKLVELEQAVAPPACVDIGMDNMDAMGLLEKLLAALSSGPTLLLSG